MLQGMGLSKRPTTTNYDLSIGDMKVLANNKMRLICEVRVKRRPLNQPSITNTQKSKTTKAVLIPFLH
jgi:hypothetical protein